jgi:hypothetical protein
MKRSCDETNLSKYSFKTTGHPVTHILSVSTGDQSNASAVAGTKSGFLDLDLRLDTFMQTDMVDTVHMVLEGTMAKLLVKIDPKLYRKYLLIKKGKPVINMYVQLKKAFYGTLQAGLLFWNDLTKNPEEIGLQINPYDWCYANKMIEGN